MTRGPVLSCQWCDRYVRPARECLATVGLLPSDGRTPNRCPYRSHAIAELMIGVLQKTYEKPVPLRIEGPGENKSILSGDYGFTDEEDPPDD